MKSTTAVFLMTQFLAACSGSEAPSAPSAAAQPETSAAQQAQPTTDAPAAQAQTLVAVSESGEIVGVGRFTEGTHYESITPRQPTSTDGDMIEVAEVFMYSCPHCLTFEPFVEEWNRGNADYINFVRIPAAWNALAELHAQAFYTAEVLGKLEDMHSAFFQEFHANRNTLDTKDKLAELFARFGVDEDTFSSTFDSFAVQTRLQRAKDLVARYRVPETPSIVVNGRYLSRGELAQTYENWFAIIDELAAVEWASKQ